jgi:glycosyltransferase involved in cell wall biosynthesis
MPGRREVGEGAGGGLSRAVEGVRSLYVSTLEPGPRTTQCSGIQQRGDLLVEALASIGELEVLVYTAPGPAAPRGTVEGVLRERWARVARVHVAAQRRGPGGRRHWHLDPLVAPRSHVWAGTSGPEQVAALEAAAGRGFDLILAQGVGAMQPVLVSGAPRPPVYFDMNDIPHRLFVRRIPQRSWPGRLSACVRLPGILWTERRMASASRRTFVCSELDRRYLSSRWRLPRVAVVPNAVAVPPASPVPAEPNVLFVGGLDYPPNAEAAELLITRIWPLVRREVPEATLRIVGRHPDRVPSRGSLPPGVELTGHLAELAGIYRSTRLVCAPVRVGAGTRVKLIEAAAHGRPIVATPLAAEGLGLRDGIEVLLAREPRALAAHCIRLLRQLDDCQQLGCAARRAAERSFDRERVVAALGALIASDLA